MILDTAKIVLSNLIYYSGIHLLREAYLNNKVSGNNAIILMYHRVMPLNVSSAKGTSWMLFRSHPGIVVTPDLFDEQVKLLKNNYNIISLSDLCDIIKGRYNIPKRTVVITFDDGWRDNYDFAFPILKKYNAPATIFIPTGYVGSNKMFWQETLINYFVSGGEVNLKAFKNLTTLDPSELLNLPRRLSGQRSSDKYNSYITDLIERLKDFSLSDRNKFFENLIDDKLDDVREKIDARVFLNWDEIDEMSSCNIDFGSHCVNHEILTKIDLNAQIYELTESYRVLKEKLPLSSICLAYPNGNYNDKIKSLAAKVGYICAVTTKAGQLSKNKRDIFALDRINVHNKYCQGFWGGFSKARFSCYIYSLL